MQLLIDGTALPAELHREELLCAARAIVAPGPDPRDPDEGRLVVTIVSRGVPPEQVRLTAVADLTPYLRGREEQAAESARRHPAVRPEELDLPPVHGLDAHRALIESSIRDAERTRDQIQAGRRPRRQPRPPDEHQRMWEAVVRAQMHLAEQSREVATEQVPILVNQLITLALETQWFVRPELRSAAVGETLGYFVLDAAVDSRPAQRAWQRFWQNNRIPESLQRGQLDRPGGPLPPKEADQLRRYMNTSRTLRAEWRAAWEDWAQKNT